MIKPGVGALAIFTFINSWNDYFMQLIMLSSTKNLTISLGIAKMQAENSTLRQGQIQGVYNESNRPYEISGHYPGVLRLL